MPTERELETHRLKGDRDLGQLFQFSGSEDVRRAGRGMASSADSQLAAESRYKPINLGKGIMLDTRTGESTIDPNYQTQLDAERAETERMQGIKDTAALKRAEVKQAQAYAATRAKQQFLPQSERKGHRAAQLAVDALPEIISLVEQSPGAFGSGEAAGKYFPDWMPNVVVEGTKNIQQNLRTDTEQKARAAVVERASAIIKQLSGAAVSPTEETRLLGFLPGDNDTARTVVNKLTQAMESAQLKLDSYAKEYPGMTTPDMQLNPAGGNTGASTASPVGDPLPLPDGTTWQEYSDGTTKQVK